MNPLTMNALVAVVVILFFLIQGTSYFRDIKDKEMFFLYGRNLHSREYSPSFAAASTSLATVLFFFVTLGVEHGIYILFAPLTYFLGCYVYSKLLLPRLADQGFFKEQESFSQEVDKITLGTTLANYIEDRYKSKSVKVSIILVALLGLLSILLIELFVGVSIFSIYLKEQYVDWALLLIAFIVFTYTSLGGMLAVVKTDRIQFKLMVFSTLIFLLWLIWVSIADQKLPGLEYFFVHPPTFKVGILLPYALLFNILVVNLFLVPSLLRTWQMAAASPKSEDVRKGIMNGAWLTTALTTMFILIGILFFHGVFPSAKLSLVGILNSLHTGQNIIAAYIILPLFFAACLAALISTADSALLPVLQSFFQDFKKPNSMSAWKHHHILIATFFLLVIAISLYFVVFQILGFNLISWLFTIFSFLIICTPSIIFAVLAPADLIRRRSSQITALISIWGGFAVAISFSIIGNKLKVLELVQLNSPLAALFGSLCFGVLLAFQKKLKPGREHLERDK